MKKRFFYQNLRVILLPVLIPVLVLGTLTIFVICEYLYAEINARNLHQLENNANSIDYIMDEMERINISISSNPSVVIRLKRLLTQKEAVYSLDDIKLMQTLSALLSASANQNQNIDSMYIYFDNENGSFITSNEQLSNVKLYYDQTWLDSWNAKKHDEDLIWSEVRDSALSTNQQTPNKLLTLYRKIFIPGNHNPDGVIVLNINIKNINKMLSDVLLLDKQSIHVLDQSNKTLIFSTDQTVGSLFLQQTQATNHPLSAASITPLVLEGQKYVQFTFPSSVHDWYYISLLPRQELYHLPDFLTTITLVMILIVSVAGVSLSYYYSCRNYDDIQKIVELLECATEGKVLPEKSLMHYDAHQLIIHNVLEIFLQNNYLNLQLSKNKYQLKTLELLALQSQMNPHFLFNTLQTLYCKVIALSGSPESDAPRMIENLSDILRYALDAGSELVPMKEEINITKSFIEIQKSRFVDLFDVEWKYPQEVEERYIPKLLLQPLVENAITHGIKPKNTASFIKIQMRLSKSGKLHIVISDNGIGISQIHLAELRKKLADSSYESTKHIGLFNTNKRLALIYGGNKSVLKIWSKKNMGTIIWLSIPVLPVDSCG